MTTNKVKSHSTRSLLCLILFRKNIFCRGQSLDACYQRFMTKGCKYATKCQCPLGLIPHFYLKVMVLKPLKKPVSMPSRAYTSFLPDMILIPADTTNRFVSMPSRAYTSFLHWLKMNIF